MVLWVVVTLNPDRVRAGICGDASICTAKQMRLVLHTSLVVSNWQRCGYIAIAASPAAMSGTTTTTTAFIHVLLAAAFRQGVTDSVLVLAACLSIDFGSFETIHACQLVCITL